MSRFKKRALSLLLVPAIAVTMAVPTFAETFDNGTHEYHIRNNDLSSYNYLNMEGSGDPTSGRNVTVYSRSTDGDQLWYITDAGNGKKVYNSKKDTSGNRYTLNINNSNNNCNVYPDLSSNNTDSVVAISGSMASFSVRLSKHSGLYYLYAYKDGSRDVRWGSTRQTWNELA